MNKGIFILVLTILFVFANSKLIPKQRSRLGRAVTPEPSLLKIQIRGNCVTWGISAASVTVSSKSSPNNPSQCLPIQNTPSATNDYSEIDDLTGHYVCVDIGENRAIVDITEVYDASATPVNEYAALPYILGITNIRPIRVPSAIKVYRAPTCTTREQYCTKGTYDVTGCTNNNITITHGWIVNADRIYLSSQNGPVINRCFASDLSCCPYVNIANHICSLGFTVNNQLIPFNVDNDNVYPNWHPQDSSVEEDQEIFKNGWKGHHGWKGNHGFKKEEEEVKQQPEVEQAVVAQVEVEEKQEEQHKVEEEHVKPKKGKKKVKPAAKVEEQKNKPKKGKKKVKPAKTEQQKKPKKGKKKAVEEPKPQIEVPHELTEEELEWKKSQESLGNPVSVFTKPTQQKEQPKNVVIKVKQTQTSNVKIVTKPKKKNKPAPVAPKVEEEKIQPKKNQVIKPNAVQPAKVQIVVAKEEDDEQNALENNEDEEEQTFEERSASKSSELGDEEEDVEVEDRDDLMDMLKKRTILTRN